MSFLLAMIATSAMEVAQPYGTPIDWIGPGDYADGARQEKQKGVTRFRLLISSKGFPLRCDIVSTSKYNDLDRKTCQRMMKNARFKPAKDTEGLPLYGTFTSWVRWADDPSENTLDYDLLLAVKSLPSSIKTSRTVKIGLLVTPEGKVEDCAPDSQDPNAKILGAVACQQAKNLIEFKPSLSEKNTPIRAVQDLVVLFVEKP